MKKMRIAIIGQGRSGRDIHGKFYKSSDNDFCEVVCVVEADEARREKAKIEYGCEAVADYTELFGRTDIDVVVNASYSQMHYAISKDLLSHGFNVLCEKPLARTYYECMDLILTAKQNNCIVAAFHQTLYAPSFLFVKEVIESGKLGNVFQMSFKYSGFARRWDWQTLQSCCAGSVFNSGPHPIGQALCLLGWDKDTKIAFSSLGTILTSGDSDDYGKIILTAPNKPVVDIEVNSVDAYASDFVFKICGSKGTLLATNADYQMKYVKDLENYPERPVIKTFLADSEGNPAYCSEKLEFTEEKGEFKGSAFDIAVKDYYKMLYNTLIEGKELEITPEQAAMVISVIEGCHTSNPLPVKFD